MSILGQSAFRQCKYCQTILNQNAIVCHCCNYHQNKVRNTLVFLGGITGLVTLILASISTIFDRTRNQILDLIDHPRVALLDLNITPGVNTELVLSNTSRETIFVEDLIINWNNNSSNISIKEPIDPGKFFSINKSFIEANMSDMSTLDGLLPDFLRKHIRIDFNSNDKDRCIIASFSMPESSLIYEKHEFYHVVGKKLVEEPGQVLIFLRGEQHQKLEILNFAVTTYFLATPPNICDVSNYK